MKKLDKLAGKLKDQLREVRILSNDLGFKIHLVENLSEMVRNLAVNANNKAVTALAEELQDHVRQAHAIAIHIANQELR